jgi:hypothetical protein
MRSSFSHFVKFNGESGAKKKVNLLSEAVTFTSDHRFLLSSIPDTVKVLGELTPDHLIEIVARAIRLITDGDAKYPVKLPPGIASRHRLCTDMANKIRGMGYSGEMGYNQLLYPAESTTRSLLGFLVERLPRTEDEASAEVLGPGALLNRRIITSLTAWSKVSVVFLISAPHHHHRRRHRHDPTPPQQLYVAPKVNKIYQPMGIFVVRVCYLCSCWWRRPRSCARAAPASRPTVRQRNRAFVSARSGRCPSRLTSRRHPSPTKSR